MADTVDLLRAQDVSKWYGATHAVRKVSLTFRAAEIHAIVGANGSGKSTLVRMLAGAESPDDGTIVASVGDLTIGAVHQHLSLFPGGTVRENVCGAASTRWLRPASERRLVDATLRRLGITTLSAERPVQHLPVDQQALVAVARALAQMGDAPHALLIIDEVTSVLRGEAARRFAEVLERLRDSGIGIVLISHDLDEVLALADRVTVMADGQIRADVTPSEVTRAQLIELMTGRAFQPDPAIDLPAPTTGAPTLRIRNLSGEALDGLDLDVSPGEIVGIIGTPGSGYEEVPYLVGDARRATSTGSVEVAGKRVRSTADFVRAGGRIIPADRSRTAVVRSGSLIENFMLGHQGAHVNRWGLRDAARERSAVKDVVSRYGVKCEGIDVPISSLSGGNQQKLIMARCLEANPPLIVIHEPTQGVDIKARAELLDIMRAVVARERMGVLYVCGDLDEVWDNCTRVVVIRRGRVVADVPVTADRKESIHHALY